MYTLAYADDIVLLAEDEEGMRSMIERLERYMERKRLEVNTEKTKIMRFRRGGHRMARKVWRGMETERKRAGGCEGVQVCGVCNTKERGAGGAGDG